MQLYDDGFDLEEAKFLLYAKRFRFYYLSLLRNLGDSIPDENKYAHYIPTQRS